MITKTYMIPEENVENLEKKFNAAARKIRKINPELEPTMTKSNHTIVLVHKIELRPCDCRSETTIKEVPYEARRVELKIPMYIPNRLRTEHILAYSMQDR